MRCVIHPFGINDVLLVTLLYETILGFFVLSAALHALKAFRKEAAALANPSLLLGRNAYHKSVGRNI